VNWASWFVFSGMPTVSRASWFVTVEIPFVCWASGLVTCKFPFVGGALVCEFGNSVCSWALRLLLREFRVLVGSLSLLLGASVD
jgi:hypothetical protein